MRDKIVRREFMTFRVTREEKERIISNADSHNLNSSDWMREKSLETEIENSSISKNT